MSSSVREVAPGSPPAPHGGGSAAAADEPVRPSVLEARLRRLYAHARRRYDGLPVRIRRMLPDAIAYVIFLILAVWTTGRIWVDPYHRVSAHLESDNIQFQWWLAQAAHSLAHGQNPLFSAAMNAPLGLNLMGNTSVLGVAIPLAPVTLLFGPQISYAVYLTLALAGSAAAAYHVFSRHLVTSRPAAFVGGAFFGFAPGVIHHANGQPNFVTNFLLPFIVLAVFRLGEPGRVVRHGLTLGLLVTWQVFINEELLLLTAIAVTAAVALYAVMRWPDARRRAPAFVTAGAIAVGSALVLLAYPIWYQFRGPQHYHGIQNVFADWGEDVTAYFTFARDTLAGTPAPERTIGITEQNSWFGWPLMILLAVIVFLMWRRSLTARIVTVLGVVFAALAAGPELRVRGHKTSIPGPWRLFDWFPLIKYMYPARVVYIVIGCVAVALAVACNQLPRLSSAGRDHPVRRAWWLLVVVALLPIVPKPMPGKSGPDVPAFIADGTWRRYVDARHTLVTAPPANNTVGLKAVYWQAVTMQGYNQPGGYFIGPDEHGVGQWGPIHRPTFDVLINIALTGRKPTVTAQMKQDAVTDLRYWKAAIVVLDLQDPNVEEQWETVTALTGITPTFQDGVWVWDVRPLVGESGR